MDFGKYHIEGMQLILGICALMVAYSFWKAHNRLGNEFNAFDFIMKDGRADNVELAFMVVLAVSTWVIIYLLLTGKFTESYFMMYLGAWVTPLIAKRVFNKTEPPVSTTTTSVSVTEKTVERPNE